MEISGEELEKIAAYAASEAVRKAVGKVELG